VKNVYNPVGALLKLCIATFEQSELAVTLGKRVRQRRPLVDDLLEPTEPEALTVLTPDHI
jgi:hypothetical protein